MTFGPAFAPPGGTTIESMLGRVVARAASIVTRSEPPRIFIELGRHPRLFRSWLPFAGTLLRRGDLPRADTELVILRTAWNCRCPYEWVQHVELAHRAGLRREAVDAVPEGDDAAIWTVGQRRLLQATDELHESKRVAAATATALLELYSERQLIELCLLVGHYEMLAMFLNSRRVEPEPTAVARLHPFAAEVAEVLAEYGGRDRLGSDR